MTEDHSGPDLDPERARAVRDRIRCSFCGKRRADVDNMVCGPTPAVAICRVRRARH
jgi:hypothetical protein